MKLYYSPGACSLSPHILLREAKLEFELEKTDIRNKVTASGENFLTINPKGYVPALQLDNGQLLTEGPVIAQYIADLAPSAGLIPPAGQLERYRAQEWLNFVGSEIHKRFSPLFQTATPEAYKQTAKEGLANRLSYVADHLSRHAYLMGDQFTAPDAYLFTTLRWSGRVGVDLAQWPALVEFVKRVGERPAVQAALQAEGLAG